MSSQNASHASARAGSPTRGEIVTAVVGAADRSFIGAT